MAFAVGFFFPNQTLKSPALPLPSVYPSPFSASQISTLSSSLPNNAHHHLKLKHLIRTSSEGVPIELTEDSKFVPVNPDELQYGPPALLLLGFEVEETVKINQLLKGMDGEFLQIILCTEEMITRSLWDAINTEQPNLEKVKIAQSLPRICFLSGLTGEEMMMFIDAFPEAGLEPAVFAALVPNSAEKPLQELIEEIMGDHEMLTSNE
ncbi:uncharacterized protein LOC21400070 [Morus notabilis]|uniref:uncharacterized protein LOC21400070 n=1 Tax=Morus notabilis TaxID=981085 RepID=UPI000CED218B|nr:uncharacterized protein LOC21400070 [Morus notabilis]